MKQPIDLSCYTKLNIACNPTSPFSEPWLNIDIKSDVSQLELDVRKLPDKWTGKFWEIRASHVVEHLYLEEWPVVLREWLRVLRPGGVLRLALPDLKIIVDGSTVIDFLDDMGEFTTTKRIAKHNDSAALHNIAADPQNLWSMTIAGRKAGGEDAIILQNQNEFRLEVSGTPPQDKTISAVFALAFNELGQLLAVRNERGWDIPGGHVEPGETPEEALHREIAEEAGATIENVKLYLSASAEKSMLFYLADVKDLLPFTAENETDQREFMHPSELIGLYGGGKPELLTQVVAEAMHLRTVDSSR